jgi:uncharacterized membrane protein
MDGWDWVWGTLMMLLFWGGLAAAIVFAIRISGRTTREGSAEARPPDAWAILEARFARGEISQQEFEERRGVLDRGRREAATSVDSQA